MLKIYVWLSTLAGQFGSSVRGFISRQRAVSSYRGTEVCQVCRTNPVSGHNKWCLECNTRVFSALDKMDGRVTVFGETVKR